MRKLKKLDYTFLIICEGENTEPSFFKSIVDKIIDGLYKVGHYEKDEIRITIRPEPKETENNEPKKASEHKPQRNNKKLKRDTYDQIKTEPFPLNFVVEGQKELEDNTYDEVWLVFDHDNHPARKEAFEQARKLINDRSVNIAFSSIAFEFYLLIHFERLYKSFKTSECREGREKNRKHFNCYSGENVKDCFGSLCIGGYARSKNYWKYTKTTSSTFYLIEDKLEVGFINSAWIRFQSEMQYNGVPVYDRNPYITADTLVKRLTGLDTYNYEWFANSCIIENLKIGILANQLIIENLSKYLVIIPKNSISDLKGNEYGARFEILPNSQNAIDLTPTKSDCPTVLMFTYGKTKKVFEI